MTEDMGPDRLTSVLSFEQNYHLDPFWAVTCPTSDLALYLLAVDDTLNRSDVLRTWIHTW